MARSRARNSEPEVGRPLLGTAPRDTLFSGEARPLMPYLQMAGRFGANALKPGALVESDPVSNAAQALKTELAKIGVRYSFDQALVFAAMSDRVQGSGSIGFYEYSFFGNWTLFEGDEFGGTAGWMTAKVGGDLGLGVNLQEQSIRTNIGAIASPNNNSHSREFAVEQLAWAQSFADGELVLMLGMINQTNYLDINRYANSSHGQFMNSALVNSMVIPAPGNNMGVNIQWQPVDGFYAMFGAGPNNQDLGTSPFHGISSGNVSYVAEFGFIASDFCGLGPGVLRVQPFVATWEGDAGGGIAFNVEQQLGKDSPLGVFGRLGFGDDVTGSVPGGVKNQASVGLAMLSPFTRHGCFSQPNNDFAGIGFVWSQPVDAPGLDHRDEYALELTWAFQITPTATIQPDLQFVWDPINNPSDGPATVFQIQLNIAW